MESWCGSVGFSIQGLVASVFCCFCVLWASSKRIRKWSCRFFFFCLLAGGRGRKDGAGGRVSRVARFV